MDVGNDQLVKHQTVTGEYGLNCVARLKRHDCTCGAGGAVVLALRKFAGALTDGVRGVADNGSNDVFDAECRLRVHEWGALRWVSR